jgi:hypothetical protein
MTHREPIIAPVLVAVARAITLVTVNVGHDATRITAVAELEVIKKRLQELRAFLAHESAEVE